jgi:hypothetical protein
MTETLPEAEALAMRRAVRRFTRTLAGEAMLELTARVEARIHACQAGPVFGFDAALATAWPPGAGEPPRREVIWASSANGLEERLSFSAFDADGRVLLRRTYGGRPARRSGDA